MWQGFLAPIFPFGQLIFILGCFAIIGLAMMLFPNRKRVLMAASIFIVAWQGGVWLNFIQMDIRVFHVLCLVLLFWNLSESNVPLKSWKPFLRPLLPWLLMVAWSIISISRAISIESATKGPAIFLVDLLFFFAIITSVKTPRDFRFLVICIAAAIIGQAVLALLQYKFPGFTFGVIDDIRNNMFWRAKGTFRHPNHLGMVFLLLLPIMIRGLISALISKDFKLLRICIVALVLGGVGLITTYNRGSWIGLAVGLFIMINVDLFDKRGKIKKYARVLFMAGIIVCAIGSIKFGDKILDRVFHDNQEKILAGRQEIQEEGIQVMMANPILGVGYANEAYYAKVVFVHNVYVLVGSEIGIPGLVLFIWFLLEILYLIVKGCRAKISYVKNYSRGFLASLIGFVIASIPGPDFWINSGVQHYFWLLFAAIVSLSRMNYLAIRQAKRERVKKRQTAHLTELHSINKTTTSVITEITNKGSNNGNIVLQ